MARKPMKSIKLPGLPDTYTFLQEEQVDEKLERKANIDGSYEDMTVGNAEQLVSSIFTEDRVPYKFRTAGGSADIGNRETDMIVGGSLVWNQLASFENSQIPSARSGLTFTSSDNKSVTINGTADTDNNVTVSGWFYGSNGQRGS